MIEQKHGISIPENVNRHDALFVLKIPVRSYIFPKSNWYVWPYSYLNVFKINSRGKIWKISEFLFNLFYIAIFSINYLRNN